MTGPLPRSSSPRKQQAPILTKVRIWAQHGCDRDARDGLTESEWGRRLISGSCLRLVRDLCIRGIDHCDIPVGPQPVRDPTHQPHPHRTRDQRRLNREQVQIRRNLRVVFYLADNHSLPPGPKCAGKRGRSAVSLRHKNKDCLNRLCEFCIPGLICGAIVGAFYGVAGKWRMKERPHGWTKPSDW